MITFKESLSLIRKYKLPIVKTYASLDFNDLIKHFEKMRKPLILKVYSPDIVHKTDIGCLVSEIYTKSQLKEAYKRILKNAFSFSVNVRIECFLMQEVERGIELIVGAKNDETFGKIVLFGLGGIYAEVLEDVAIRALPIDERDIDSMLKQIKGFKILSGYRGKKFDLESLKLLILKLSRLIEREEIKEVDLNPVFINERGVRIADWKFYR